MSEQYSLAKILGIWALATAPMGILGWIVFSLVAPDFESDPLGAGVTRLVLLTLGLVWLFVLSMIIVRREEGDLRWATVKRRLRLNAPRDQGGMPEEEESPKPPDGLETAGRQFVGLCGRHVRVECWRDRDFASGCRYGRRDRVA